MTFQSFLDMMQQRGEDCNLMVLDDEAFDEVVPVPVVRYLPQPSQHLVGRRKRKSIGPSGIAHLAVSSLLLSGCCREFAENFLTGILDLMTELHITGPERSNSTSYSRMASAGSLKFSD